MIFDLTKCILVGKVENILKDSLDLITFSENSNCGRKSLLEV